MGTIIERIQLIISQYYNNNESAFCRDTGINQKTANSMTNGKRSNPGAETIVRILTAKAVNVSAEWLILGKGEMVKSEQQGYIRPEQMMVVQDQEIKLFGCKDCIEKEKRIADLTELLRAKEETIGCLRDNIQLLKGTNFPLTGAAS